MDPLQRHASDASMCRAASGECQASFTPVGIDTVMSAADLQT